MHPRSRPAIALLPAIAFAATASAQTVDAPAAELGGPVGIPTATASLPRLGGHARPGFDDIEVVDAVDLPFREIVRPSRFVPGSLSLGTTSDGHLERAARLPIEGPGHFVLPAHRARETHYATEELVALLVSAGAAAVAREPTARLGIGNLSYDGGGDIPWSRSHNNGRDADIAFLFRDADGNPVDPDTLVTVDRRGRARDGSSWTFDAARTWIVVEELIRSEHAQIQWLFIYAPLREALLEHAAAIEAEPWIIERAERLLHQPSDSARHDDHLHVRIYCSRDDRVEGCVNWGPEWVFVDTWEDEVEIRVRELVRGLMTAEDAVALECARFLRRLEPRRHAARIAAALPFQVPDVQLEVLDLLEQLDQPRVFGTVAPLAESSPDPRVRERAFALLGSLGDPGAADALLGIALRDAHPLADGRSAREMALHALRNTPSPALLPGLIALADDERAGVREAADVVLQRITLAGPDAPTEDADAFGTFWKRWYAEHAAEGRDGWIASRFRREGRDLGDFRAAPPWRTLIDTLEHHDQDLAFVADRLLVELSGEWSPLEGLGSRRRRDHWRDALDL